MPTDNQNLSRELHRIAVTVIIYTVDEKEKAGNGNFKYLVTKRAPFKKVHPNKWTVPGGGLTMDDYVNLPQSHDNAGWYGAVEKGLQREIAEEVNVNIGDPKYLLNLTFIRPDNVPVLVLSYYAPFISGEVKLDAENVESRWVTLAEAKDLDLIAGIYEEIEEVDAILRKHQK